MKEYILFFIMALILFFGAGLSVYQHELAHKEINRFYGTESHIEVSLGGMKTVTDESYPNNEARSYAYVGHSFNEAVGYQITPLFVSLFGLILVSVLYLGEKIEARK